VTARRSVILAAALALAGCVGDGAPLIEVAEVRFAPPEVDVAARAAQVRRAAAGLGWATEEVAPGRIRATLEDGGGRAAVEVAFDRRVFSVRHEVEGRTEPAYNVRVARLRDAIVAQSGV
jgi:hypothetical protein